MTSMTPMTPMTHMTPSKKDYEKDTCFFGTQKSSTDNLPSKKACDESTCFFGTYKLTEKDVLDKAMRNAYDSGFRHFDLAELYKNQHLVGEFFQENKINRTDIWITSKVSFRIIPKGEEAIRKSIEKTFEDLKTDYIDLMLIHAPTKNNVLCWNILQEYKQAGKIINIGISNFNVTELEKFCNEISNPQDIYCNQIEFNPFLNRTELINICKQKHIKLTCYGTLYKSNDFIDSLQEKYGKSSKQILIRFAMQKGFNPLIMAIEKEHLEEDKDIEFTIDEDDYNKMDMFDENYSLYKRYL
jgi:diketogulonate reductase-like aldo/keto reductase